MVVANEKFETQVPEDALRLITDNTDPMWAEAINVEAQVFIGSDYVENAGQLEAEYEPYMPNTMMIAASRGGEVVGSVRVIRYSPDVGFKTLKDAEEGKLLIDEAGQQLLDGIELGQAIEIGTISIKPEWRKMPGANLGLNLELYGAIFGVGQQLDAPYVIASFDERYFNRFQRFFGENVRQLGPAIDYMGSPTLPVIMDMAKTFENIEQNNPDLKDIIEQSIQKLANEDRPNNINTQ